MLAAAPLAKASSSTIGTQEWWLYGSTDYSGAWPTSLGDGVTVAVIGDVADTSVSDLSGSFVNAETFPPSLAVTDPDLVGSDCESTEVASLIAGHGHPVSGGTDGVVGVAAHAKVMPLGITVQGTELTSSTYFAEAMQTAVQNGAKVIDVVVPTANDPTVYGAIQAALAAGVVIVVPSGDIGSAGNVVWTPAVYPGVIAVAASERNGTAYPKSAHSSAVSVAAPGVGMIAAGPGGHYVQHTGTDCAAALVAAEAALLIKEHPSWTAGQVERVILDTASGGGKRIGDSLGYGVVNPTAAVAAAAPSATTNPLLPQPAPSPAGSSAHSTAPAAAASGGGGSSGSTVLLVVIAVAVVALLAGFFYWFKNLRPGRRRYVLPAPAAPINLGPSDYAAYQQPPQQQPYYGQPPGLGEAPAGYGPVPGVGEAPAGYAAGYPEAYPAPGYPQAGPFGGGLDESGYSINSFAGQPPVYPEEQPGALPPAAAPDQPTIVSPELPPGNGGPQQ
jgi:hypothetical protein